MTVTIQQVIELIPDWCGRKVAFQSMPGGFTNTNYRVEVDDEKFFVRIPNPRSDPLAVVREKEYQNTMVAAETGVGPKVYSYLQEQKVLITEFIEGEAMSFTKITKLQAPGMPTRLAQSMKLLHAGPRFKNEFNVFQLMDHYIQITNVNNIRVPAGFTDSLSFMTQFEDVLILHPMNSVPCHNDLIAENIIDDSNLLRFVDFEYSGNNDPCFELGNAAQSMEYNDGNTIELCTAYFGELRRSWFARVQLYALTAHMIWTAWNAIQNVYSDLDYDFWCNVNYHWDPALKTLSSELFTEWLEDAQITGLLHFVRNI